MTGIATTARIATRNHWISLVRLIFLDIQSFTSEVISRKIASSKNKVAIASHGAVPFPFRFTHSIWEKKWMIGSIATVRILHDLEQASTSWMQDSMEYPVTNSLTDSHAENAKYPIIQNTRATVR